MSAAGHAHNRQGTLAPSDLALGPGGLASMAPAKPSAMNAGIAAAPYSRLLMMPQTGNAAAMTQAPVNSGIAGRHAACSCCPRKPPPSTPTAPPLPATITAWQISKSPQSCSALPEV